MNIPGDKRLEVLLDDLRYELRRLNENLEAYDEADEEVSLPDEYR